MRENITYEQQKIDCLLFFVPKIDTTVTWRQFVYKKRIPTPWFKCSNISLLVKSQVCELINKRRNDEFSKIYPKIGIKKQNILSEI